LRRWLAWHDYWASQQIQHAKHLKRRSIVALARDDGRYANSPLKSWFDRFASGNGLCCSFADGFSVDNVDWDAQGGHYRVRLYGE
jgi:hypothetical protein